MGPTGRALVLASSHAEAAPLAAALRELEYVAETAVTEPDGVAALRSPVDIALIHLGNAWNPGTAGLRRLLGLAAERGISAFVVADPEDQSAVSEALDQGAVEFLLKPLHLGLLRHRLAAHLEQRRLRERESFYEAQVRRARERSESLFHAAVRMGIMLLAEKDYSRLLERILVEAKEFCHADAGTLYLRTEDDRLRFEIMRTDSLGIALGGTTGTEIPYAPLRLFDEATGEPVQSYVVTQVAHSGRSINIPDAYDAEGFDFSGTRAFDAKTGYRSTSFLTLPLKNTADEVIGVLQLINARDADTGSVIPFAASLEQMVVSLASLAAICLEAYRREQSLRHQIEVLRIEIDEAKKNRQVAEIVDSEYFDRLRQTARTMRARGEGTGLRENSSG